ncbi:MAG: HalOD1 output domain-containing protein [Salinigranum sp.]
MSSTADAHESHENESLNVGYGSISCGIRDDESVVKTLLEALDSANVLPKNSGPVLNDVIDPDGLELLFSDRSDGSPRRGGELTFQYNGATITVTPHAVSVYK